jgi:hypothetical protein
MFVTSEASRGGLLVAVITGGRPLLSQRPTARMFEQLRAAGVADIVWVANERHAAELEPDGTEVVTYSDEWAYEFAASHWTHPGMQVEPGGFFGAFPGREAACREAERRGCWGVLQLDDNILHLSFARSNAGSQRVLREAGGATFFVDMMVALAQSSNARMVGCQLDSVPIPDFMIARRGFPYSLFIEKVGEGREEWFGPFEDDIMHALQYSDRPDGATTALITLLRYQKESTSRTGMRSTYNDSRAQMLQRLYPDRTRVIIKTHSNGLGGHRVFHQMPAGAIRNPLVLTDPALYGAMEETMLEWVRKWRAAEIVNNREKARKRLARLEKRLEA